MWSQKRLSAVFVADYVMSHFVLKLVKTSVELSEADDTEAISKEVRMLLSNRSVFYRRFAEAYPEVIYKQSALPSAWRRSVLRRRDCGRKRKNVSLRCG